MNRLLVVLLCLLFVQQTLALRIFHLKPEVNASKPAQPVNVEANATANTTSDANKDTGLFFEITKALKGAIEASQADADKNQTTVQVLQNRLNDVLEDAREEVVGELNKTDDSGKPIGEEIEDKVLGTVDNALNAGKVALTFFDGQLKDALTDVGNETGLFSDAPIGGYMNGTKSNERGADGFVDQINNQYGLLSKLVEDSVKTGLGEVQGLLGVNATTQSSQDHPAVVKTATKSPESQVEPSSSQSNPSSQTENHQPRVSKAKVKENKNDEEDQQERQENENEKEEEYENEKEKQKQKEEEKRHSRNPHKKSYGYKQK